MRKKDTDVEKVRKLLMSIDPAPIFKRIVATKVWMGRDFVLLVHPTNGKVRYKSFGGSVSLIGYIGSTAKGGLPPNGFNAAVYSVLDGLVALGTIKHHEREAFLEWARKIGMERERAEELKELQHKADRIGFTLVRKEGPV